MLKIKIKALPKESYNSNDKLWDITKAEILKKTLPKKKEEKKVIIINADVAQNLLI